MTLADLRALCLRYVPLASRHPGSLVRLNRSPAFDEEWWYAHEIGHLLTVPRTSHGQPLFGLDSGCGLTWHALRCHELAAMNVSWRLLCAVGRRDLARAEVDCTDDSTVAYDDRGDARRILREFGVLRLPWSREGLERKLRLAVGK